MYGPPCFSLVGFSRQLVGILKEKNAEFGSFNILMDEEVRQGEVLYIINSHVPGSLRERRPGGRGYTVSD